MGAAGGRNLVTTENGFVGIVVPNIQSGDVVSCLYGWWEVGEI